MNHDPKGSPVSIVLTAGGPTDADRLVAALIDNFPPEGRNPEWIPETSLPWMQKLREEHRRAVLRRRGAIRELPDALLLVAEDAEALRRGRAEQVMAERRALLTGVALPEAPELSYRGRSRLEQVWSEIDAQCRRVADAVEATARAVQARRDVLWRTHVAHARHGTAAGVIGHELPAGFRHPPKVLEQRAIAALYADVLERDGSADLTFAVDAMRDFVSRYRRDVDPPTEGRRRVRHEASPSGGAGRSF